LTPHLLASLHFQQLAPLVGANVPHPGPKRALCLRNWLLGRRKTDARNYCKRTKDITDLGTETASYKALQMGNDVCDTNSTRFFTCYPSHPLSITLYFTSNGPRTRRFAPGTVQTISLTHLLQAFLSRYCFATVS
jgi:hypothetical protein